MPSLIVSQVARVPISPSIEELKDQLVCIDVFTTGKKIAKWTPQQRREVYAWAMKSYLAGFDDTVKVPPRPDFI